MNYIDIINNKMMIFQIIIFNFIITYLNGLNKNIRT